LNGEKSPHFRTPRNHRGVCFSVLWFCLRLLTDVTVAQASLHSLRLISSAPQIHPALPSGFLASQILFLATACFRFVRVFIVQLVSVVVVELMVEPVDL
jgi:hypothetical protein